MSEGKIIAVNFTKHIIMMTIDALLANETDIEWHFIFLTSFKPANEIAGMCFFETKLRMFFDKKELYVEKLIISAVNDKSEQIHEY